MDFWVRKPVISLVLVFTGLTATFCAGNNKQDGKLKPGDPIPDVVVRDQNAQTVHLASEAKTGYTLFFFYPRALTRGCTAQACSLRDAYAELQEKGVKIFGVSTDAIEKQKDFEVTHNLPYRLLADTDKKVIKSFGVPLRMNSFAGRQAFLFKDGILVWHDTNASTDKQAEDVLHALEKL